MAGDSAETWAKRVERWRDSGLTAREFASEMGINPRTLTYWKWRLEGGGSRSKPRTASAKRRSPRKRLASGRVDFVEVVGTAAAADAASTGDAFELILGGVRLRIPQEFREEGLRRLLDVVEGRR